MKTNTKLSDKDAGRSLLSALFLTLALALSSLNVFAQQVSGDPTAAAGPVAPAAAVPLGPQALAPAVGSFLVSDGPYWGDDIPTYSCVETCALLFDGDATEYHCSTESNSVNNLAWASAYGSDLHCADGGGVPIAEDFKQGTNTDCAEPDTFCYISTYVGDWCGFDGAGSSENFCFAASPLSKELTDGPDEDSDQVFDVVVPKKPLAALAYEFTIGYVADADSPDDVLVADTLPAEWIATHLDGSLIGTTGGPGIDTCGESDDDVAILDGDVVIYKNGKAGKKCQSSTALEWTFDASGGGDFALVVDASTRQSPGKGHDPVVYAPTSCGALYLNNGAVAFDADTGEVVAGPTDPLCLAVVDQALLDALDPYDVSVDADHDEDSTSSWEEACVLGTDPCNPDTDGDGVLDGADDCPLLGDGVENGGTANGVDANGCPIVACTMTDNFSFVWSLLLEGDGAIAAGSTVTVLDWAPEGGDSTGYLNPEGGVAMTATNIAGDGCASETDWFDYVGACTGGSCSGSWISYCAGPTQEGSGNWSGTLGACELSNPDAAPPPPLGPLPNVPDNGLTPAQAQ